METTLFQRVFWIVIASIGISGPVESVAAPTRLPEIQERPSVTRADNAHYLPSVSQLALLTPVADTQSEASSSNANELMQLERLGEFKIGNSAARILETLGNPQTRSRNVFSEADALYRQSWYYPKQGITFQMVTENENDKPKIASIKLTRPSKLETDRGIKIGDSYDRVVGVYGQYKDQENSVPFERLVAGSIYGGLIFSFQDGRVLEIFLGAAAE
jgi:hypothetical protein